MKINLKTEFGSIQEYIADKRLIAGLLFTDNIKNVKRNLKAFKIKSLIGSLKITTIDNYSILTLIISSTDKKQFLITSELNLEQLTLIPDNILESELKEFIILSKGFTNCITQ